MNEVSVMRRAKERSAQRELAEAMNTFDWFNAQGIDTSDQKAMQDWNTACIRLGNALTIAFEILGFEKP